MPEKLVVIMLNSNPDNPTELFEPIYHATIAASMEYHAEIILSGQAGQLAIRKFAEKIPSPRKADETVYEAGPSGGFPAPDPCRAAMVLPQSGTGNRLGPIELRARHTLRQSHHRSPPHRPGFRRPRPPDDRSCEQRPRGRLAAVPHQHPLPAGKPSAWTQAVAR